MNEKEKGDAHRVEAAPTLSPGIPFEWTGGTSRDRGPRHETNGRGQTVAISAHERRPRSRIVLGVQDLGVHQEVLDFLQRDARVEVVAATSEVARVRSVAASSSPDVVVVCPEIAHELPAGDGGRSGQLVVVASEMTVPVLRDAIEAGASGVFAWPDERDDLANTVSHARRLPAGGPSEHGKVIAVCGARGGAGVTFVASHLAASLSGLGLRTVLVDLDRTFADVTVALGVPPGDGTRTIADLLPVVDELSPDHLDDALYAHPRGFSALLSPTPSAPPISSGLYAASVALLAAVFDVVVLHLPRDLDDVARRGIQLADDVVLVTTLDLFSLHGARCLIELLALGQGSPRLEVVINKLARGELSPRDVERVLGVRPSACIRLDGAVGRAQSRGELLPARSRRANRDIHVLAKQLAPHATTSTRDEA